MSIGMFVEVFIISSKDHGHIIKVNPDSLQFVAKGYSNGNVLLLR